ncbi:hypothetical protein C4587_03035 [Candidatus Parcubacteria bacterium]|nr:MAG: hypothetical protein C4587_03035 [Candidatus Parcubacteria bacterium]
MSDSQPFERVIDAREQLKAGGLVAMRWIDDVRGIKTVTGLMLARVRVGPHKLARPVAGLTPGTPIFKGEALAQTGKPPIKIESNGHVAVVLHPFGMHLLGPSDPQPDAQIFAVRTSGNGNVGEIMKSLQQLSVP